jgi:hypothetical protein
MKIRALFHSFFGLKYSFLDSLFFVSSSVGNKLNELAADGSMIKTHKSATNTVSRASTKQPAHRTSLHQPRQSIAHQLGGATTATSRSSAATRQTRKEIAAEMDFVKKNGRRRIPIRQKMLFANYRCVIERLDKEIEGTLADCYISLNVSGPFMSEQQMLDLNPLCIRLDKCSNMPSKPLSYEQLRKVSTIFFSLILSLFGCSWNCLRSLFGRKKLVQVSRFFWLFYDAKKSLISIWIIFEKINLKHLWCRDITEQYHHHK